MNDVIQYKLIIDKMESCDSLLGTKPPVQYFFDAWHSELYENEQEDFHYDIPPLTQSEVLQARLEKNQANMNVARHLLELGREHLEMKHYVEMFLIACDFPDVSIGLELMHLLLSYTDI